MKLLACLLVPTTLAFAFTGPSINKARTSPSSTLNLAPAKDVWILPDEEAVTKAVHKIVVEAAEKAIKERGNFAIAIPGGSVLKILSTLEAGSWAKDTTLVYVNHKCVSMDDEDQAIHAKAKKMFLDRWGIASAVTLDGTGDSDYESAEYCKKLKALPEVVLPRDEEGYPVFDLCLVGVGDDGHIGSLYPNRDDILTTDQWVVGVNMKTPPGISLTLPVMQRAKKTVVAAAGQSAKYPKGKAEAMKLAIQYPDVRPQLFPACALREDAIWILDEANASDMPEMKRSKLEEVPF
jgi:6-phosphogluconolactonase